MDLTPLMPELIALGEVAAARRLADPQPLSCAVAAVSVGVVGGRVRLDLPYEEDVRAETDMNVVVTGAAGFVGSHVVRRLNERGIRPRIILRPTSNRTNLIGVEAEVVEGDLLDPSTLRRALEGCEQLYHLAGFVSPRPSQRDRLFRDNVQATVHVMDIAREMGVPRVVYLGSTTAIGASNGAHPIAEDAPYNLDGTGVGYFEAKRAVHYRTLFH